jgi:hypothetical protein
MKKLFVMLVSGTFMLSTGIVIADSHEKEEGGSTPVFPIEMFACAYNEGQGAAELDATIDAWNDWADKQGLNDYTAWTLVPYYMGPEQEFDVIWLGVAPTAAALGRAQDSWVASGGEVQEAFDTVISCEAHAGFTVIGFKQPAERADPDHGVVSFSDCNLADGVAFSDLSPSLQAWAEYKGEAGSAAGIWTFMPGFGGGAEEYDFKYAASWQNLEEMGSDWDQQIGAGWKKGAELFAGKVECDSSRVYLSTTQRRAAPSED